MNKTDLRGKTINGFFWGLLESILSQGLGMLFGIVLARILLPEEFGLLGMIIIFTSVAQIFVDGGLSEALIRKRNCTEADYSTVFWANLTMGILLYIIMWSGAPFIASFYKRPELIRLTRVASLTIIIGSLTMIQQAIIIKEINFKKLAKISTISTFISGTIAIAMAFKGFGVWSLVSRVLISQAIRSSLLWKHNKWLPMESFNKKSFKELFSFGSNIMIISIITGTVKNLYGLVIGKTYSAQMLGFYTNADQYSGIPSNTIASVTNKVSYPLLTTIQDDNPKIKASSSKLIKTIMYVSFFCMFGLAAVAKSLFLFLFGEKWLPSVIFFQILCIAYSILPLLSINQTIMKIKGRSDLFLRTEVIKYIIFIPFILIGIIFGLKVLITGIAVFYWMSFFVNAMYTNKLVGYSIAQQLRDLLPALLLILLPALLAWSAGLWLHYPNLVLLLIQSGFYFIMVVGLSVIFNFTPYFEIKQLLLRKISYIRF